MVRTTRTQRDIGRILVACAVISLLWAGYANVGMYIGTSFANDEFESENTVALCSDSVDNDEDDDVDLADGDCEAFFPTLTVIKHVINDDGGEKSAHDFDITVSGSEVSDGHFNGDEEGTAVTLMPGAYSVDEDDDADYEKTLSEDCSGEIAVGEVKTCTITNNDIPVEEEVPPPPQPSIEVPECDVNGLYGSYYNLPATHPDVGGDITGHVPGTTPFAHDWYSGAYLVFSRNDAIGTINVPSSYFPIPSTIDGDPFYFAVHWTGSVVAPTDGVYNVTLGSDDDSWLYVNGEQVVDLGGVQALDADVFPVALTEGESTVDLYFAERHLVQSGIVFSIDGGVIFSPCPPDPNGPPFFVDFAPGVTATEGEGYSYDAQADDPDGDELVFSLENAPDGMIIDPQTGIITWTPTEGSASETPYEVTIAVSDGIHTTTETFEITVGEPEVPPPPPTPTPTPNPTPPPGGGGGGGGGGGFSYIYELVINNGDVRTTTTSVTLALTATGATEMWISNNEDFSTGEWEPFTSSKPWELLPNNGEKVVYAKFRSPSGDLPKTRDVILLEMSLGVGGALNAGGEVLGAATTCGIYLNSFIKYGAPNNPSEVEKLQRFLNEHMGETLPVTGFYGEASRDAVDRFQLRYKDEVLRPWLSYGHPSEEVPTGYVYKTTRRWINMLKCRDLRLPLPDLP